MSKSSNLGSTMGSTLASTRSDGKLKSSTTKQGTKDLLLGVILWCCTSRYLDISGCVKEDVVTCVKQELHFLHVLFSADWPGSFLDDSDRWQMYSQHDQWGQIKKSPDDWMMIWETAIIPSLLELNVVLLKEVVSELHVFVQYITEKVPLVFTL